MNKYDKYYLKQGKLELSMLDDEDDEYEVSREPKNKSKQIEERLKGLNLEHTKRIRDHRIPKKLSVSKEVYSTLHTMGQYLTKNDQGDPISSLPARKPMNSAKAQLLEELASSVKIKDVELPPANTPVSTPVSTKQETVHDMNITQEDQIKSMSDQVDLIGQNRLNQVSYDNALVAQQEQAEAPIEQVDTQAEMEPIREIEYEVAACYDQDIIIKGKEDVPEFESKDKRQYEIDMLIQKLIKPKIIEDPTAEALRKHINRKIEMIRSYNKF